MSENTTEAANAAGIQAKQGTPHTQDVDADTGIRVFAESLTSIDVDVGISSWQQMGTNRYILEEDFKVSGEIWRVHLSDAAPFSSSPHAHCIGATRGFIACKLHMVQACPATGKHRFPCPGYVVDHIKALACGGADSPENMQWQTREDAKAKTRREVRECRE